MDLTVRLGSTIGMTCMNEEEEEAIEGKIDSTKPLKSNCWRSLRAFCIEEKRCLVPEPDPLPSGI
jgi:hypothetical protein